MRVRLREFSIFFHAPLQEGLCQYGPDLHCFNPGQYAIQVLDDRDQILKAYGNICAAHLIIAVLDQLVGN